MVHGGTRRRVFFPTVQDTPFPQNEGATIGVYTDTDGASDPTSKKSTSSVFTTTDGFLLAIKAQVQDTHEQISGKKKRVRRSRRRKPNSDQRLTNEHDDSVLKTRKKAESDTNPV